MERILVEINKVAEKRERFLDCGCGDGNFGFALSKKLLFKEVYGIDVCEDRLKSAKAKGVRVCNSSIERPLPFRNNLFDFVVSNHTIEHVVDPDCFLDEIHRVLKPGGIFAAITPNLASWYNRIILLLGYQPHYTEVSTRVNVGKLYYGKFARDNKESIAGHIRIFTYPALRDLLIIHRFKILKTFGEVNPFILSSNILKPFELLFRTNKMLASFLCFICQKEEEWKK